VTGEAPETAPGTAPGTAPSAKPGAAHDATHDATHDAAHDATHGVTQGTKSGIDYEAVQESLRRRAAQLLEEGAVVEVIGWESSRFERKTTPFFLTDAACAHKLAYNEHCANTLAKYLLGEKSLGKVALCVRGCDSRAVNRLIADRQLVREDVHLIGLPCGGMRDTNGDALQKCKACTHREPVICDEYLGDKNAQEDAGLASGPGVANAGDRFKMVSAMEKMPRAERERIFNEAFSRCIRCYSCREACPCCSCRECFVDQQRAGWQGKQNNLPENRFYNLTRVFHIGDRCIECGECERVCPMSLPLMILNRKMILDLDRLFAAGEAGLADDVTPALGSYDLNDREEFM
jgi:ferredoxin